MIKTVNSCINCPFIWYADDGTRCVILGNKIIIVDTELPPPGNCPLRKGEIIVRISAKARKK